MGSLQTLKIDNDLKLSQNSNDQWTHPMMHTDNR
jgi:hypothetical protein